MVVKAVFCWSWAGSCWSCTGQDHFGTSRKTARTSSWPAAMGKNLTSIYFFFSAWEINRFAFDRLYCSMLQIYIVIISWHCPECKYTLEFQQCQGLFFEIALIPCRALFEGSSICSSFWNCRCHWVHSFNPIMFCNNKDSTDVHSYQDSSMREFRINICFSTCAASLIRVKQLINSKHTLCQSVDLLSHSLFEFSFHSFRRTK